jgi:hypothetical protein
MKMKHWNDFLQNLNWIHNDDDGHISSTLTDIILTMWDVIFSNDCFELT